MHEASEYRECPLFYKIEGSGEPVVFIQGVGLHGDGWLPQTEALNSDYKCLTFDNRGIGRSPINGSDISVEQMARDALAVMDVAKIDSAHIVGHSLGGIIALQVAFSARHRVRSLSLLCTSARGADATRLTLPILWLGLRSRIGSRAMRADAFLEIIMPSAYLATKDRAALAQTLEPIFGHNLADSPPIVMRQLNALKRFNATDRLRELAGISTLVLSAAHDIIFPPEFGRQLAAAIPGSHYLEIAEAAHGVTIQCSGQVNRALREHVSAAAN